MTTDEESALAQLNSDAEMLKRVRNVVSLGPKRLDVIRNTEDADGDVMTELEMLRTHNRWLWFQRCIDHSLNTHRPISAMGDLTHCEAALPPRFPSALGLEDFGFYGLTVLAGEPGTGKSMAAIASALEAAAAGWRVVYVNTELDKPEMRLRIRRAAIGRSDFLTEALKRFSVFDVSAGIKITDCAKLLGRQIHEDDERVLLVVDSVNTLAELSTSREYNSATLDSLSRVVNWLTQLRRLTYGEVAVIAVSELNAGGGLKGRKIGYSCDLSIAMENDEESDSVRIRVLKSRSGPRSELGLFWLDWQHGRFVPR